MKVDGGLMVNDLAAVPERTRSLEAAGYDAVVSAELANDPLLPLLLAAEHSERVELHTSITVAFARSPMTLAQTAHDINVFSKGRLALGLGSQIRPHITKRFGMPWDKPAARMREFILAMRAIWNCWYQGEPLDFRGDFYTHTLMTPMFTPRESRYGAPRVFLAAVGPRMTAVAGEVADGMIAHGFTTDAYMRKVTLPAIERGLAAAGRSRKDFEISCPLFVVTGTDEREFAARRDAACKQLAFYASTPAYRGVLEEHGWGELQPELTRMSKRGLWDEMGGLIEDDILKTFAVVAEPDALPDALRARCQGAVDRLLCMAPLGNDETAWVKALR